MAKRSKAEQMAMNKELDYALDELNHGPTSVEEISNLLERGADPMTERGGVPLIYWATKYQSAEIVKLLLDKSGFDVNFKSDEEFGPEPLICWDADNKDFRVFSMLINEYGAQYPLEWEFNPIMKICFTYKLTLISKDQNKPFKTTKEFYCYLKDKCQIDDQNIFWNAVRSDCLDLCKFMEAEKGINLELENKEGEATIHLASHSVIDIEVLKWLVNEEHISPETESSSGMRPIHFSCQDLIPSMKAIDFLVNCCKVDTEVQSDQGMCPIHYIARSGITWALKDVIEKYHFDYTIKDADGWIPLDYTIYNKDVDSTKYLVKKYGKKGIQTAFEHAFSFKDVEYVEFLSEECGFDLKKEKWVELFKDEANRWSLEELPMIRLFHNDNVEVFKYCFENHFGEKLPSPKTIPFFDAFYVEAYAIIAYLISKYSPETYLDSLLEEGFDSPGEAFCEAARLNDTNLLKYLVGEKGVTLEEYFQSVGDRLTPIHWAIRNGNLEIVKCLVEDCHANPLESNYENGSTILYAAHENQIEIADYLIEKASALGTINACYSVVLAYIEDRRYKEAINCIEKYDINVDDLFCSFCVNNNKNMVVFLKKVYAKYDINLSYEDEDGNTALVNSLLFGSFGIFKWLVEDCGQNPEDVMKDGKNALIIAARGESPELIKYLVEKCNLDVNSKDDEGNSAIIYAINGRNLSAEENIKIIHLLVEHGADINLTDSDNENTLHYIARNSFYDIKEFEKLILEGADFMARNKDYNTPLHEAAEAGRLDVVQSLIEKHNVNPNLQCRDKATPAHLAARNNETEIVKWLIENGYTKVNRKDKNGDSILGYAVIGFCGSYYNDDESHLELVRWLVENGADYNSKNWYGITPLHEAANEGNLIVVKYFIEECGMNPSIGKDEPCGTPAEYAKEERAVVRYLHKKEKEYNGN